MNQPPPVEEEATTKLVTTCGHSAESTAATVATTTVTKVNTLASFNPEVVAGRASGDPAGWCSCFQICKRVDKTSLVVETAGENHSLLPNHLNEQQNRTTGG